MKKIVAKLSHPSASGPCRASAAGPGLSKPTLYILSEVKDLFFKSRFIVTFGFPDDKLMGTSGSHFIRRHFCGRLRLNHQREVP